MKDPYLLAGVAVLFGCICAKRTPVSLVQLGCVYCRAVWGLMRVMVEGAWERRGRWRECVDEAWRRRR